MFRLLVLRVVGKEGSICSKCCSFLLEWTNQAPVVQRLLLPEPVMFIIDFLPSPTHDTHNTHYLTSNNPASLIWSSTSTSITSSFFLFILFLRSLLLTGFACCEASRACVSCRQRHHTVQGEHHMGVPVVRVILVRGDSHRVPVVRVILVRGDSHRVPVVRVILVRGDSHRVPVVRVIFVRGDSHTYMGISCEGCYVHKVQLVRGASCEGCHL